MAEFSKQYCEINDPDFPWDFDIEVEAEKLDPDYAIHMICEGFGFTMIAKDESGNIILGFPSEDSPEYPYSFEHFKWIPYLQFIQEQKSSL